MQPDPVKIKYCGCNDETCSPDDCLFCSPTGYEDCPVCSPFECLTKCKSCEECDGSGECVNICDTQNCEECVEFEENGQTISRCESKCGQNECCNGSGECRPCGCEEDEDCPEGQCCNDGECGPCCPPTPKDKNNEDCVCLIVGSNEDDPLPGLLFGSTASEACDGGQVIPMYEFYGEQGTSLDACAGFLYSDNTCCTIIPDGYYSNTNLGSTCGIGRQELCNQWFRVSGGDIVEVGSCGDPP